MRRAARLAVWLTVLAGRCHGASLWMVDQNGGIGKSIVSTVSFAAMGDQVSSLQFDLEWDPALKIRVVGTANIGASSKKIYTSNLSSNSLRVLIAGENGKILQDGVLVNVIISASSAGSRTVDLKNTIAASPDGSGMVLPSRGAAIQVAADAGGSVLAPEGVVNAASLQPGAIAPGEILTLFGAFAIDSPSSAAAQVNGTPAPLLYAGGDQVNAVVPFEVTQNAPARIALLYRNREIASLTVPVTAAAPALFTQDGTGVGQGAILNQDYTLNSPNNPAAAGSVVMMFGTGFGTLRGPSVNGQTALDAVAAALPVTAGISGLNADVLYAGAAPGLVNGVVQINVRVPAETSPDAQAPVSLTAGSSSISPGVTMAVR